jgi:hypothetical protein
MSTDTRLLTPGRPLAALALILTLAGLLLAAGACESLDSDTAGSTATVPTPADQTAAAAQAGSAQALFGIWEGTYTTLEVRNKEGLVTHPPVPLNTPLDMRLELHAWSEASRDCGTVAVAGYPNGRVMELSVEGSEVRLSIINQEEGLEDSQSLMTLILEGDTLTGQDEPAPDVPEGWYVTRGTVYLTRAASAATSGTQASGDGHTEDSTEASSTGLSLEYMGIVTVATTGPHLALLLSAEHNGQTFEVHVGDYVTVVLPIEDLIPDWVDPNPGKIDVRHVNMYPQAIEAVCIVVGTGTVQLRVRWVNTEGALQRIWSVNLSVTD